MKNANPWKVFAKTTLNLAYHPSLRTNSFRLRHTTVSWTVRTASTLNLWRYTWRFFFLRPFKKFLSQACPIDCPSFFTALFKKHPPRLYRIKISFSFTQKTMTSYPVRKDLQNYRQVFFLASARLPWWLCLHLTVWENFRCAKNFPVPFFSWLSLLSMNSATWLGHFSSFLQAVLR